MTLTAEERAEVSRRNGRKSRGPSTEEGKGRSRRNAMTHGLRAEALPLPGEDAEAVRARQDAWQDYYRPGTPAAQHLLNQCVHATMMADRCIAYHHAALSKQVRRAESHWDHGRRDEVERLRAILPEDPATAVRLLRRSGHGCRWLISRWERLAALLDSPGYWHADDRKEAIRLLGSHLEPEPSEHSPASPRPLGLPEPERSRYSPEAFLIHLHAMLCQPTPTAESEQNLFTRDLKRLFDPLRIPPSLRESYGLDSLLDPEHCRQLLRKIVAEELATLRPLEARLREEIDMPERAEAGERAFVLQNPAEASLFLRYHAEARTSFHRAHRELIRAIETGEPTGDGEGSSPERTLHKDFASTEPAEPGAPPVSPNEPEARPPVSPNEPDGAVAVSPNEPDSVSPNEPGEAGADSPNEPRSGAVVATVGDSGRGAGAVEAASIAVEPAGGGWAGGFATGEAGASATDGPGAPATEAGTGGAYQLNS